MTALRSREVFAVLLRKDLRLFTQRAQYRLYLLLILGLVAYGTVTGTQRYLASARSFEHWSEIQKQTVNGLVYSGSLLGPGYTQRFRPTPMSAFAIGADDLITSTVVTRGWSKQQIQDHNVDGPISNIVLQLDFLTLVLLLGSLFTVYLCHDFLINEVINRTIITTLLFNVSARLVAVSKLVAMLISVTVPVLALFCVSALAVGAMTGAWGSEYFARCAGFVAVLLLYQAIWVVLSCILQAMSKTQRDALIYGLAMWVFVVFVVPNGIRVATASDLPEPLTVLAIERRAKMEALEKDYRAWRPETPRPTEAQFEGPRFVTLLEKTLLDDGTYHRMLAVSSAHSARYLSDPIMSLVSPYTAAGIAATEFANTGISAYNGFRRDMLEYMRHYQATESSPEFDAWTENPGQVPFSTIAKLDVDHPRPSLGQSIDSAKTPLIGLLAMALILTPLSIILMTRHLQRRA